MTTDLATASRPRILERPRLHAATAAVAAAGATAAVAAAQGGYFPTSWGWTALGFLWVAGLALVLLARVELTRAEIAFLALVVALVGWIALSIVWSSSVPGSVAELERSLVYAGGFLAFLVVARPVFVVPLLGGVLAGLTGISAYALATRLFPTSLSPDLFGGYRLSTPVGYWNGLGLLAAVATLLAIGFAASESRVPLRAAAAAALPLLLTTLYFTYSRGAWVALAAGLALELALDPRRLRFVTAALVLAPAPALTVWLASRSKALTHTGSTLHAATHQGHRLALWVLAFAALGAGLTLAAAVVERRVTVGRRARRGYAAALAGVAVAAVVAGLVAGGGPVDITRRAYDSFTASPVSESNLNRRLFQLSSNGRTQLWHVAWREFRGHPALGTGAGTFEEYWYEHRDSRQTVRNAHSLYLETLGELGVPGLVILLAMLAVPFAGARARARPLVPIALGAYTAFLVHAVYDWDWELPALTLAGVWCGLAALVAARDDKRTVRLGVPARAGLLAVVAALGGFAFVGLVGNMAAASAGDAVATEKWSHAAAEARRAAAWAPWAARPWYLLAQAELAQRHRAAALAAMRTAIAKEPRNYVLWQQLAFIASGREQSAAVRRVRELDPQVPFP